MRVEGLFTEKEGYLSSFSLEKRANVHSVCRFSINLMGDGHSLIQKVGQKVNVYLEGGKFSLPVFCGKVCEIQLMGQVGSRRADVVATSFSCELDEVPFTRIFQNPGKSLKDMANRERLCLSNCFLRLAPSFSSIDYQGIVVQNQETDFAFLRRLAASAGQNLWVIDTNEGATELVVDKVIDADAENICLENIISLSSGQNLNGWIGSLVTDKYFRFGHVLNIENVPYVITEWELYLEHGVDRFRYTLSEYKNTHAAFNLIDKVGKRKFLGRVRSANDPERRGRVQIDFNCGEIEDKDKEKTWIHWRTPYIGKMGGVIFLPDVDDSVEAILEGDEFYAFTALRDYPLPSEAQKVDDKYIFNNTNEGIIFRENSLELMSGENKILLMKDRIEMWVKGTHLELNETGIFAHWANGEVNLGDNLVAKAEGKFLLSTSEMQAKSKGNVKLTTSGNINAEARENIDVSTHNSLTVSAGGDTQISSGGNLKLRGSKVEIA